MRQTSLLAYKTIEHKLGPKQKTVLEALEEIAPATDKQLAEHLGWPINTVTPRRGELYKKGKVIEAYVQRDTSGRPATFWKPKEMVWEYGEVR